MVDVVCLRPERDFHTVGVNPPKRLSIAYRDPTDEDVPSLLKHASAIILPSAGPHLQSQLFEDTEHLRLIQFTGAGWDRIPEPTLRDLKCFVANVPGVNAVDVAEYVMIMAGTLLRKLRIGDQLVWNGEYTSARSALAAENVRGFRGMNVGVIGLGHIGFTVGKLFHMLGARVLYYDPEPRYAENASELGFERLDLNDLLEQSDVVTIHVPLVPATRGLLGPTDLDHLKEGAILIQASRGGVVDEAALVTRLRDGHIAGVAMDVYTSEPLPAESPILQETISQDRLILTPHIAGVTRQAAASLYTAAWENVERVLFENKAPLHQVL